MCIEKAMIIINQTKTVFVQAILISFCLSYGQIEIDSGKHAKVLEPSGGEVFYVGDTVHIQFLADSTFGIYFIKISVDSGKSFNNNFINPDIMYFRPVDPDFKNVSWVIPETLTYLDSRQRLKKLYSVSEHVVLQLDDIWNSAFENYKYNSGVFSIVQKTTIEIDSGKHMKILEPSGGESFKVGDTVHIEFLADSTVQAYTIRISVDSGKTFGFNYINPDIMYYRPVDPDFKNVSWVIPETLTVYRNGHISKVYMVSEHVMLRLDDIFNSAFEGYKYNSEVFSIIPNDASRIDNKIQHGLQTRFNVRIKGNILFSTSPVALVKVVDLMGRIVTSFAGNDALTVDIKSNLKSGIAAGVYKISVQSVKGETAFINWVFLR